MIAADFEGTLQSDAYLAYGSFVKKHPRKINLAGMLGPCATQLLRGALAGSAALWMDPASNRASLPRRGEPPP